MRRISIVVIVAAMALLSACGGSSPSAAKPTPDKQAPTQAVQSAKASPTEAADTTAANGGDQANSDNADIQLTDEATALKSLRSYKTTWSFEWSGKREDGTEQTVKWLSSEAYTSEPQATYTKFESTDSTDPAQGGAMEFYQIGSKSYMVTQSDGKPSCMAFSSEDSAPSPSLLDRNSFGSINSGKLVSVETINGVQAKHYKYDEKATGVQYFTKLTGDVWIAEDGGYVVKDVAEWEGHLFGMLAGGSTSDVGKGSWKQEVTAINQSFQITPPEGCENAAESLPMMADATEGASFGAMTTYKSASKMADVVKFYQTEMPKAGWAVEGDPQTSDNFSSLEFTKDGKKASVVLTSEDTTVNVIITVE